MILQKILPFTIILLCIQVFAQKVEKVNIPFKYESIELKYKDIPFERTYIGKPKISVDSSILKKYQYHDLQKGIKSLMFKFMGTLVLTNEYSFTGKDKKIATIGAEIFQGFQKVPEANYPLSKIDVNENLFTNSITAVTEDQYGTMWVGYSTGEVSMIRGSQIKTFTYLDGFPHDYISTIKAIDDEIWIGTFGGGLHVFKDNHLTSYNKDNGFPVDHVTTICRDADNNTWIGTYNHGIILIKDNQVYHYEQMPEGLSNTIEKLQFDSSSNEIMGLDGDHHLFKINEKLDVQLVKVNESGWNKYTLDFHIGNNIQILFTDNIVATVKSQVIETRKIDETYKLANITEVPSGNLWLGSNTGEVVIVHPSFYSTITKENGGPAASISSIYNDRHGNIWINTYGEGIYMTFASNFRSIINKNDDLFKLSGSIYASENNGVLLFEQAEGGICLMQPDYLISKYQHKTLKNITGIAMTDQKIWITSMHGFYEISNDSIYHYNSQMEEGFNSNTGLVDNKNNLIINNYNYGWLNFDPKNRKFNVAVHKQRPTYSYNSFVDSKERVWISSAEGGLFFVSGNILSFINKDILQINDLAEDISGNIYIAGSEGLFEYTSNGELFELRWESETHVNIRSILYDKNLNSIWLGTTKGLKLYDIDDEQIEQFGNNRGINGDYFSKNGVSKFNGRTYWSTNNSVVEFIPFDFRVSTSPPEIYVQSILLDYLQPDYENLKLQTLLYFDSLINNVPYGLNLTEEFNSISFVLGSDLLGINTGLNYYYSIDNEAWVGPILNEDITINNLTVGKHLIQFKAIDINENESNTIRFEFEVTKPIYKQAWFLILISVLFIGLLIGFYLVRNRISFKRFEAYSNFNTNLSRLQFLSGLFTIGFPLMEWSNVVLNETEVFRWNYLLSITSITLIFFICTFIKNINARFITYFALFGSTFIVIVLIDRVFTEHLSNAYMILAIISMAFMVIVYNSFKNYLIHFVLVNSFFVIRTIYYEDNTPDLVVFVVGFIFIQLFSVIFHFFQINRLDKINFSERILNTYDKLVLVYNDEGNVVYVNPYLCNLVSEDEDNILGDKWYQIRHCDAERTESIKDSIKKQIKNSNTIETITEIIYSVPLKEDRYINWSFQILDDKYLMAIGNDITEAHLNQLEIEQAHQIIEENNRDMLDSINYALRIQQSLLPNLSIVSKTLPNHFIYYRPKDIVSGDFYYLETLGSKIFIGIADCTGHGVPGAMMTSIGSAALNNAILDKKISDPGKILTHVDSYFKASLSLNKDGYTDGMDISLIAINLEDKTLEYCGAKRPLITYTPEKGMTTYLGTKRSIGESNLNDDSFFTTTAIPIENEMQVYAFTDGITDQFGGPAGKKFYITNLNSLIESILELPMHGQEEIITNTILQWMGEDHSQTDDMLMLGFKIDQAYLNKMSRILG